MNDQPSKLNRRWEWLPILVMLFSLPVLGYGVLNIQSDTTAMSQWLAEGQSERQKYADFVQQFGPDDFVIVSWPGCNEQDPRFADFVGKIRRSIETGAASTGLIRRIISGPELLDRLTQIPVQISRQAAVRRLSGTMMSEDGATQCALIEVTEQGNLDPHGVIETIESAAAQCGVSEDELRMGGGIYEAVHVDLVSQNSFRRYVGCSAGIAVFVALVSLRSVWLTAIVIAAGGYGGALSVALVYFAGLRFNVLMLVLPTLVYVLVISGAIHLVNYYLDEVRQRGTSGAAARALAVGWVPCTLASVTTAIGMMSLAVSQIGHVRSFGIFSAVALLVSLCVMLAFVPTALALLGSRVKTQSVSRSMISDPRIEQFANFVIRRGTLISIVLLVALGCLGVGLSQTTSTVKLERMFAEDDQLIRNYRWLEANIGPLAAMEILVRFDDGNEMSMLKRLNLLRELGEVIERVPEVGKTFSAVTLTPVPSRRSGLGGAMRRVVFNKRLESAIKELAEDRVLIQNPESQTWRITARITALHDIDHVAIVQAVGRNVQATPGKSGDPTIRVDYTGTILVMSQARKQLLEDLVKTFAAAFLLICPLMMVILGSVVAGFVSMIPNLVPAVVVFGSMGWLGFPIEIGTVLTACVALGIAVDDTLHFLTWYRRGMRSGDGRQNAIRLAYQRCTVAMIQTTVICGFGLLVFVASDFVPTSRFAVLMFALLLTALIGDLVFLPALLASPLGKYFRDRANQTETTNGATT